MKKNRFIQEVEDQPATLLELVKFYESTQGLSLLKKWGMLARRKKRVVFSGMGTSEFAPEGILPVLAREGVDASILEAGEGLHYPRLTSGMTVLISQSGESIEIRHLAPRVAKQGFLMAITNNETSSLAKTANLVFPLHAGEEKSISTKTYTNTMGVLYLMAKALRGENAIRQGLQSLRRVAEKMPNVDAAGLRQGGALLCKAQALSFVSRGPSMAAVKQMSLTFIEGTRILCSPFTGGGFRHGPYEMLDRNFRAVFMIPRGATEKILTAMVSEVTEKGGRVVVITDTSLRLKSTQGVVLHVPFHGEELFGISAATTQERLLNEVARRRGLATGQLRHCGKITARE